MPSSVPACSISTGPPFPTHTNDAGWITALYNTQSDPGDISYFVYSHDRAGNRLTNTSSWGTQTYTYDNIYQVTEVESSANTPIGQ